MKKTTFFRALIPAGLIAGFGLILGLGVGGGLPAIFASHGGPLNWIEGIHLEAVALSTVERPILMGGDDGTNLVNVLVDSGGRLQVDIIAGGGGSQTEDAVAASGETGAHLLAVRDDTPASATAANADYQSLVADAFGGLYVRILGTSGAAYDPSLIFSTDSSTGAFQSEDVAHATADVGIFALAVANLGLSTLAANGDYVALAASSTGALLSHPVYDAAVASSVQLGDKEDDPHATADAGMFILAVANDGAATTFGANGDYSPIAVTTEGEVFVRADTDGPGFAKVEDTGHTTGDVGIAVLAVRDDTPVASKAGATNDYDVLSTDDFGGLYVRTLGTGGAAFDPTLASSGSPVTLVDTFVLFDGSAETQIATTNFGASKAITITGTGVIEKVCIIVSLGTPFGEAMSILFFDADPAITVDTADLTLAEAQNVQAVVTLTAAGFRDNFAAAKINCQDTNEVFSSITHVVFASEGATTYDDEDIEMRLLIRRRS